MPADGLTFGLYPLHVAGTPFGVADGPPDDDAQIGAAIADLRGDRTLRPRTYLIYTASWREAMLANAGRYARAGILSDVVIGSGDWTDADDQEIELEHWLDFIREVIRRHGDVLSSVQITNEPNLSFMEGSKAYIVEALVRGVVAARREIEDRGLKIAVGFGSVPDGPAAVPGFWDAVAAAADDEFVAAVDFVGHNFYVDVFEDAPVAVTQVPAEVDRILGDLRARLDGLGLPPRVAIRVTENGWPTGTNPLTGRIRSESEQVEVLEAVVHAVWEVRETYGVSHYVLFGLRDADSRKEDLFHRYGILRDDYSAKPAYAAFRGLIRQLGV
ncbi:hypothetical protein LK09_09280 [Microbacterium mangrovi]|uniref:Uncharacterized protein n=1 Tax=Microbacterium mangrovi TaxID=1348253 RepID=A0A0B2A3D6_9MICO|nr:hypothetical protein [Microbacterium mangrovi]KHK98014.1 hypothetical protein LK09_09280 [Microbacterium mangrovi]